jgi:putative sigma-54 modulation protein
MIQGQDYNLTITTKHVDVTDGLKQYLAEKLSKVQKLTSNIIDVYVKLEVQKLDQSVLITMKFSHFLVTSHAMTTDLYASIDLAIDRMMMKLRKWKTKIQAHHHKKLNSIEVPVTVYEREQEELNEINDAIEEANQTETVESISLPKVVKSKLRPLKILTLQEALLKMELSDDNFLVFRSEEDQKLKVLYKRRDESYGLLQPE